MSHQFTGGPVIGSTHRLDQFLVAAYRPSSPVGVRRMEMRRGVLDGTEQKPRQRGAACDLVDGAVKLELAPFDGIGGGACNGVA